MSNQDNVQAYKQVILSYLKDKPMCTGNDLMIVITRELGSYNYATFSEAMVDLLSNEAIQHESYFSLRIRDQENVFKAWNEHSSPGDFPTMWQPIDNTDGRFIDKYTIPPSISVIDVYDEIIKMMEVAVCRDIFDTNKVRAYFKDDELKSFLQAFADRYDAPMPIVSYAVYSKSIKDFANELIESLHDDQARNRSKRIPKATPVSQDISNGIIEIIEDVAGKIVVETNTLNQYLDDVNAKDFLKRFNEKYNSSLDAFHIGFYYETVRDFANALASSLR